MRPLLPLLFAILLVGPSSVLADIRIEEAPPDALLTLLETRGESVLRERQARPSLRLLLLQPALRRAERHGARRDG